MTKRITEAGTYYLKSDETDIEVLVADTLQIVLPKWVPATYTCKIKCLVATCDIHVSHGLAQINGASEVVLTDGILIIDYKTANFVATNLTGGGGVGDTGWSLAGLNVSKLQDSTSIAFENLFYFDSNSTIDDSIPCCIFDTSLGDINVTLITDASNVFKYIKVKGGGKITITPTAATIDGLTSIDLFNSCFLLFDALNSNWMVFAENQNSGSVRMITKKIENIDITAGVDVELEPTNLNSVFVPISAFAVVKDNPNSLDVNGSIYSGVLTGGFYFTCFGVTPIANSYLPFITFDGASLIANNVSNQLFYEFGNANGVILDLYVTYQEYIL